MERISKLLFVTTALFLFCVALIFSMTFYSGNGGEYWGYDGIIEPAHAAKQSFEAGEMRFLAYELEPLFGGTELGSPNAYRCDFHPEFENGHIRFNRIKAKHGYDSVQKANSFANSYNNMMAVLVSREEKYWCEKVSPM